MSGSVRSLTSGERNSLTFKQHLETWKLEKDNLEQEKPRWESH